MAESKKPWWKSKTIWAGIVTVVVGAYEGAKEQLAPGLPPIPGILIAILGALGIYGRAKATKPVGK